MISEENFKKLSEKLISAQSVYNKVFEKTLGIKDYTFRVWMISDAVVLGVCAELDQHKQLKDDITTLYEYSESFDQSDHVIKRVPILRWLGTAIKYTEAGQIALKHEDDSINLASLGLALILYARANNYTIHWCMREMMNSKSWVDLSREELMAGVKRTNPVYKHQAYAFMRFLRVISLAQTITRSFGRSSKVEDVLLEVIADREYISKQIGMPLAHTDLLIAHCLGQSMQESGGEVYSVRHVYSKPSPKQIIETHIYSRNEKGQKVGDIIFATFAFGLIQMTLYNYWRLMKYSDESDLLPSAQAQIISIGKWIKKYYSGHWEQLTRLESILEQSKIFTQRIVVPHSNLKVYQFGGRAISTASIYQIIQKEAHVIEEKKLTGNDGGDNYNIKVFLTDAAKAMFSGTNPLYAGMENLKSFAQMSETETKVITMGSDIPQKYNGDVPKSNKAKSDESIKPAKTSVNKVSHNNNPTASNAFAIKL